MTFDILTLFPKVIESYISSSIIKRAIDQKLITVNIHNFRDYANNKHNTVDDYSYSGGAGMLLRVDPIVNCLKDIPGYNNAHKIITTPAGKLYNQEEAKRLTNYDHIIIICGHYEGFDNRVLNYVDEEISIGDYVLTGGELASCVLVDSISRLLDGVISKDSITTESFENDLLEYPQYTRPNSFDGLDVPEILLSGHHEKIKQWQLKEAIRKTYHNRPDLLAKKKLTNEEEILLKEIINEEN